jgi:hypothetical protein
MGKSFVTFKLFIIKLVCDDKLLKIVFNLYYIVITLIYTIALISVFPLHSFQKYYKQLGYQIQQFT